MPKQKPPKIPETVSAGEAAKALGVSTRTLSRMQKSGKGPQPLRPSGAARGRRVYRKRDLREWLEGSGE